MNANEITIYHRPNDEDETTLDHRRAFFNKQNSYCIDSNTRSQTDKSIDKKDLIHAQTIINENKHDRQRPTIITVLQSFVLVPAKQNVACLDLFASAQPWRNLGQWCNNTP